MNRRVEWWNSNAYRRYPVVENEAMVSAGVTIPDSLLLDFKAIIATTQETDVVIPQIEVSGGAVKTVTVTFRITASGTDVAISVLASAAVPVPVTVTAAGIRMACVFGAGVQELADLGNATYSFSNNPRIEPALVTCIKARSVDTVTGTEAGSVALSGDIYLREGYNCRITLVKESRIIRIDAVRGGGAGVPCDEPGVDSVTCRNVFLRLNGLHADDNGNFILSVGDGLTIVNDFDNHRLVIRSAKPKDETICEGG